MGVNDVRFLLVDYLAQPFAKGLHQPDFRQHRKMTVGGYTPGSVVGEAVDGFLFRPRAFPALLMFRAGQDCGIEAHVALSGENILAAEGIAAVQGQAVVEYVENFYFNFSHRRTRKDTDKSLLFVAQLATALTKKVECRKQRQMGI